MKLVCHVPIIPQLNKQTSLCKATGSICPNFLLQDLLASPATKMGPANIFRQRT